MGRPFARFAGLRPLATTVVRWGGATAACAALGAAAAPPDPAAPASSVYERRGTATARAGAGEDAAQAEHIVAGALTALDRADPFAAKLRQKARIGDLVLTGPGRYVQAGSGESQRFRYESRLECDTESFEVLEVCDGLFTWGYRRNAAEPPGVSRVDVRRVREQLETWKVPEPASAARYLGGLQRTLWKTREWFHFTAAVPVDVDGTPMWRIEGRWDAAKLAAILPEVAEAAQRPGGVEPHELPDGVPWSVRLWVGRGDLLPRRVEWLAIPGRRPVAAGEPDLIAALDIYDIEVGGSVDAAAFFYKPAGAGLMDMTEQHLKLMHPWRP